MVGRIRIRMREIEAFTLQLVSFAAGFMAVYALLAAMWQMGLSAQMHFAPACSPDDTVRASCTFTASATVNAVTPDVVTIRGLNFLTGMVEMPLGADVSFLHPGDTVTAVEWHGHIASLTRDGHTVAAMGNPDAGPIAWPGVLVFAFTFGSISLLIRYLATRTRVTVNDSFWARR
jgi:hypothetical protein